MENHLIVYRCLKKGVPILDAFAATWVIQNALAEKGLKCRKVGLCYGDNFVQELQDLVNADTTVHFVDFSFTAQQLEKLTQISSKIVVVDHHRTTCEVSECGRNSKLSTVKFLTNPSGCAATLAWSHYYPKQELPLFLEYIEDYDCQRFDLYGSRTVALSYRAIGVRTTTFNLYLGLGDDFLELALSYGKNELKKGKKRVDALVERAELTSVADVDGIPCVELYGTDYAYTDEVSSRLQDLYPEAAFSAVLNDGRQWYLEAKLDKDSIDLGSLCTQRGGGGLTHKGEYQLAG